MTAAPVAVRETEPVTKKARIGDGFADADGTELVIDQVWAHGYYAAAKSGERRWFPAN